MRNRSASTIGFIAFASLVVLFIIGGIISTVAFYSGSTTMACTVTGKDRSSTAEGGSVYQVYTEDCGVLRVADNPLKGFWTSSDVYAQIEAEQTYEFQTYGWRFPLFSQFPTIYEARAMTP